MNFVIIFCGWIFSLCLHEFWHALVAYHGGDYTVREKGYLSFNPLKYTHPFLSIILPLLILLMGGIGLPGGAVSIETWRIRSAVLIADVYRPVTPERVPAILARTPYNKNSAAGIGREAAQRGYGFVAQDVRGRYASEGDNLPFDRDVNDGFDTVRWLRKQPWCNGRIGTWGGSAGAITQLHLAASGTRDIAAQHIVVGAPRLYHDGIYPGGVFRKAMNEDWLRISQFAPHALDRWVDRPIEDAYWRDRDLTRRYRHIHAAAVHIGGYWDIFAQGTIDALVGYQERGGISDGNLIWDAAPTLDGLGPWGDNDHCSERSADGSQTPEFVVISSFEPKALLNCIAMLRGSLITLNLEGPENVNLNFTTLNYTVYLMPGSYSAYAMSYIGGYPYANITSIDVSYTSREHDLKLTSSHAVRGRVSIGTSYASKQVAITATASTGSVLTTKSFFSGTYSMNLPRGSYSLSFLLEDTFIEASRTLYVEYFHNEALTISSGDITLNPVLAMRMDNSTFSGTVFGPSGAPQAAFVEMVANSAYGLSVSFMTLPTGEFNEQVQPGDYTVYVTREQDRRVALAQVSISRNMPASLNVTLSDGKYLSGKVLVDGSGSELSLTLATGSMKLTLQTDSEGSFRKLLPSMSYTMSSSTMRWENGLSIPYSGSTKVTIAGDNVFTQMTLTRGTTRSVSASWNKSLMQSALPGVEVTYVVKVTNTGNIADTYIASYSESKTDVVVTQDPDGVWIDFGEDNLGSVEVTISASAKARAGETKVPIQIRSKSSGSTRADVDLYLYIETVRGLTVKALNQSKPVSSMVTISKFSLNNTGNAQDNITLSISNIEQLRSIGWEAQIVEYDFATPITQGLDMPAFFDTPVGVQFTAIRANPDPTAKAMVVATSLYNSTTVGYGSVGVRLPDLSLSKSGLDVTRSDVNYEYDYGRVVRRRWPGLWRCERRATRYRCGRFRAVLHLRLVGSPGAVAAVASVPRCRCDRFLGELERFRTRR